MKRIVLLFCIGLLVSFGPEQQIKWIALGDSITYLNDHPDETGNRVAKGYLTRVVERLPRLQYINKGYNGWTACRIAEKIDDLGLEPAEIYTVFLGTNDWWSGKPVGTIADYRDNTGYGTLCGAFRVIIDKFRSLNPEAKIILMTPLQRGDFVDVGFDPDADEYPYPPRAVNMTYDGLHPSDEGNEMIARMLVKMLQKIKLY
ncbi:MAG: SGNH/GDSL hydrolase family protein [Mangrovibacterium sp.]|nr:SGNH/GDSL hydrolase family protein [Mangrovibacterium sp.]